MEVHSPGESGGGQCAVFWIGRRARERERSDRRDTTCPTPARRSLRAGTPFDSTVNVAALLVTEPNGLVTVTEISAPLSAAVVD